MIKTNPDQCIFVYYNYWYNRLEKRTSTSCIRFDKLPGQILGRGSSTIACRRFNQEPGVS